MQAHTEAGFEALLASADGAHVGAAGGIVGSVCVCV